MVRKKAVVRRDRRVPTTDRERELIRKKLERFSSQLRGLIETENKNRKYKLFPRSIDPDLAEFIAGAMERYLKGEAGSVDRSLGLVRDGPRSVAGKYFKVARDEIGPRLIVGKKFKQIWKALHQEYSEELLRQIWDRERQYVMEDYRSRLENTIWGPDRT